MAKRILYLAVGALALTACTTSDVVDDVASSRNEIRFENVVNKHTRATDLTQGSLQQFNVFGFYITPGNDQIVNQVFKNVSIVKDENDQWTYFDKADVRSWLPDAKYYFYAYSCGNVSKLSTDYGKFILDMDGSMELEDRRLMIEDYLCDWKHQHDLIFASATNIPGKETSNDPVAFTFHHALTKVLARFTTHFPKEYTVVIKNVKITNFYNRADYEFGGAWKNMERYPNGSTPYVNLTDPAEIVEGVETTPAQALTVHNKEVEITTNGVSRTVQEYVDTQEAYVIPYEYDGKNVNLVFDIEVYLGSEKVLSKQLSSSFTPQWRKEFAYQYNIDIEASSMLNDISFTATTTVNGWNTGTPVDLPEKNNEEENNEPNP